MLATSPNQSLTRTQLSRSPLVNKQTKTRKSFNNIAHPCQTFVKSRPTRTKLNSVLENNADLKMRISFLSYIQRSSPRCASNTRSTLWRPVSSANRWSQAGWGTILNEIKEAGGVIDSYHSYCGGLQAPEAASNALRYSSSYSRPSYAYSPVPISASAPSLSPSYGVSPTPTPSRTRSSRRPKTTTPTSQSFFAHSSSRKNCYLITRFTRRIITA